MTIAATKQFLLVTIALSSLSLGGCDLFGLFSQTRKIGSSEATQYVGSMNRAQQAYLVENNQFSNSLPALGLGLTEQTAHYQYSTRATPKAAFNYGIVHNDRVTRYIGPLPYPSKGNYHSYVGGVFLVPSKMSKPSPSIASIEMVTIICKAIIPGKERPAEPVLAHGQPKCAPGTKPLP